MANRRNTRRSEHGIWNLFLQLQRTRTKPIKFIWHSRLWARRVKTTQETITFADKRKSLSVIQIQEALIKPYLAATKRVKFASEGQSCRPKITVFGNRGQSNRSCRYTLEGDWGGYCNYWQKLFQAGFSIGYYIELRTRGGRSTCISHDSTQDLCWMTKQSESYRMSAGLQLITFK